MDYQRFCSACFILLLCFLQATVVVVPISGQESFDGSEAPRCIDSWTPNKDAFECELNTDDGSVAFILTCELSLACTIVTCEREQLKNVPALPDLSQLTDNCTSVFSIAIPSNEPNTTFEKFLVSQSKITTLEVKKARKFLLRSGYFCGLDAVTEITYSDSLYNTQSLGFHEDCTLSDCALRNLTRLILTYNILTVIRKSFFCGIPNLRFLQMNYDRITEIEDWAFQNLTHLEKLELSSNNLKGFPKDLFFPLQLSLKHLDLSRNVLGNEVFISLQNLSLLEVLNLCQNNISLLNGNNMKRLSSLTSLKLGGNKIESLGTQLQYLGNLEVLDLSHNLISIISEFSFSTLLNLTEIDLSGNRLTLISSQVFKSNTKLKKLNISKNRFKNIPNLEYLSNLRVFKMSANLLQDITLQDQFVICNATNLHELDLSENNISYIIPGAFSCHSKLKIINLNENILKSITSLKSSSITKLIVSKNNLTEFSFLDISTFLVHLNLGDNKITDFNCIYPNTSVNTWTSFALENLDLSGNLISVISISGSEDSSRCLFGNNSLKTIDLSGNLITSICSVIMNLKGSSLLKALKLRVNPFVCECEKNFLKAIDDAIYLSSRHFDRSLCHPVNFKYGDRSNLKIFENLNLLDNFTCPSTRTEPCQCNLNPDYYSHCGLSCPNGCKCFISNQFDLHLINCSNLNLTFIPNTHQMFESAIVNFSGNHLTFLNGTILAPYCSATKLFLSRNLLRDIEEMSFFCFHLLQVLHLDYNQLTVLKKGLFKDLKHLKTLDVSHNLLIQIEYGAFQSLGSLQSLALHDNQLTNMSLSNLENLTSLITQGLSLRRNPWSCDCDFVASFRDWLQSNLDLVIDSKELSCVYDNATTSSIPLLIFNSSDCVDVSPRVLFYQNIPMWTSIISVVLLITVTAILLYWYRKEMQVLVYSRYGIRIFQHESASEQVKRYDVFLAYSSLDEVFVIEQLLPGLERIDKPYRVCVHQRDFLVGAIITDSILEAVEVSARTIVVLSENFVRSGWCRFEFKSAHLQMLSDRCARLIVVVLGKIPTDLDPEMRLYLKTNTYLEWGDRLFWERLYFALPDRK